MSAWGGPKRRMYGVLGFELPIGLSIFFLGVRASIPLIMVAGFGAYFSAAFFLGSGQAILQTKVAPEVLSKGVCSSTRSVDRPYRLVISLLAL